MLRRFFRGLLAPLAGSAAPDASNAGVRSIRKYRGYEDYVHHQSAKLATLDLTGYDAEFEAVLGARLAGLAEVRPGASALCLGARSGAECRAFSARGCFAVGLDLNPGTDNRWVLPGDFHALQWAADCVDLVYCNALDHALELDSVLAEIRRVLKPGGSFIAEIALGSLDDGGAWSRRVREHLVEARAGRDGRDHAAGLLPRTESGVQLSLERHAGGVPQGPARVCAAHHLIVTYTLP